MMKRTWRLSVSSWNQIRYTTPKYFTEKYSGRTRENVLTLAGNASSRVRLWSYILSAGVRGQHGVQGDRFSTRRR